MTNHIQILFVAALALASCGDSSVPAVPASGSLTKPMVEAVVTAATNAVADEDTLRAGLPAFAELPPGAVPINNVDLNNERGIGGSLTFTVAQSPKEVVNFYRTSIAKQGMPITKENISDYVTILTAESPDKSKFLEVNIGINENSVKSVNLIHLSKGAK